MHIASKIEEWQAIRKTLSGKTIGLVPTMGNLHAGHASLLKRAGAENEITVASIFVNPTQFNQPKDFEAYARTLEQDCKILREAGVDYLLTPETAEMYADDFEIQVAEIKDSTILEGAFRPGHFTGVLTAVLKLFNLVMPTRAYFGEKDFQQLKLIQKMTQALFLSIDIVSCPTIRNADQLALSSRNHRFTCEELAYAAKFAQALQRDATPAEIFQNLKHLGFKPEYVEDHWGRRLAAAWLGEVRLIDNIELKGEE